MRYRVNLLLLTVLCFFTNSLLAQQAIYQTDSVIFKGAITGLTYGADLTLPQSNGKRLPAIIIMSGTGKQDRDGQMAGHKVFKEIADYLGAHGIIVLRMDDRGTGKTGGIYEDATTADFANDARTAVQYLKTRREVNGKLIGLMGHSEGGVTISIAASQSSDVAYLVSIAGLCMSGYDAQIKQNEDIVNQAKLPDYDKARSNRVNKLMFETALKYADSANMEQKLNEAYKDWKKKDSVYFNSLNVKFDHFRFPAHRWIPMATGRWYRFFIKYDPAKTLANVNIPILALNGDQDLMVSCIENLRNWKTFPAAAKHHKVTTVVLKNVNHLLLPCTSCIPAEYSNIKEGVSDQALAAIAKWINNQR